MSLPRSISLGVLAAVLLLAAGTAAAQGPFGIGTPEPTGAAWAGPFAPLFAQIAAWQAEFYRSLTAALGSLRESGGAFWLLAGLSLLYGIFHAVGPGHGKAVVTAYLLASGQTLRRGVVIAFAAALVQAVTAVALVGIAAGLLHVTAVSMTQATDALEIASYALIAAVGGWLLWLRLSRRHRHAHAFAASLPGEGGRPGDIHQAEHSDHGHDHDHLHAPDPALLRRPLTLATAWSAIVAVGIRPCSGAIIVLVFALSQGLYAAGIASTFVMALGTGAAVAVLASLAVAARNAAVRLARGRSRIVAAIGRVVEIGAALAVLLLGLTLLGGALSA